MEDKKEVKSGKQTVGKTSKAIPVLTTTAGAIAGGVVTSTPAVTAGGAAGLTGYSLGLGGLIAHVGCGSAAAISALTMVAAGPILGGALGYSVYRTVKDLRRKNGKNGSNGNNGKTKDQRRYER